jgi:hypothetical protein
MQRLLACGMVWLGLGFGPQEPLERVGRFEAPALVEVSGIVKSRKHPGIFWVHNDSGNPPALYAVKADGSLLRTYRVEAPNIDWEDIALDDSGHLYLGDIGNNGNRLPIRTIYRLDEPDPTAPANDIPLKPIASISYRFPENGRFDAESLFIDRGRAFVISKRFDGKDAEVFAIQLEPPATPFKPTLPERLASRSGCSEPATGADLSSDGQRLAVVTKKAARVYSPDGHDGWSLVATVQFEAPHVEAICWDGMDLVLASEDRSIYRISEKTWKPLPGKGGQAQAEYSPSQSPFPGPEGPR